MTTLLLLLELIGIHFFRLKSGIFFRVLDRLFDIPIVEFEIGLGFEGGDACGSVNGGITVTVTVILIVDSVQDGSDFVFLGNHELGSVDEVTLDDGIGVDGNDENGGGEEEVGAGEMVELSELCWFDAVTKTDSLEGVCVVYGVAIVFGGVKRGRVLLFLFFLFLFRQIVLFCLLPFLF